MPDDEGLRERKKRAARTAMSDAALRLALGDGIAAVTPERVAAVVEVSSRTFRNYFSSVEEAVVDGLHRRALSLVEALRERPAGEAVWDSLNLLVPARIAEIAGDRSEAAALFAMFRECRTLAAEQLVGFEDVDRQLAGVIEERLGAVGAETGPGSPDGGRAVPLLLAAAVMTAVKVSLELWVGGQGESLPGLVRECLGQLRSGVPAGSLQVPAEASAVTS